MRKVIFLLGIIGMFVGAFLMIIGISGREIRELPALAGFLLAVASLFVTFAAKIIINQRG